MTINFKPSDIEKIIRDTIAKDNPTLEIKSVSFTVGTSGDYRDSYHVMTGANVIAVPKKV